MNYINEENNNSGNNGNKGKFSDRLKKILRDRLKFRKGRSDKEEGTLKRGSRNVLKIALAMPSLVYTNLKSENENDKKSDSLFETNINLEKRKIKVNKVRNINVSLLKEKKRMYLNKTKNKDINLNKDTEKFNETEIKVSKLQKEIIDLIKKRLIKNLNELEVLQSELYVLSELTGDRIYLTECEEDIKEIKKLLSKIKSLKEKYDYLRENIDFEYMLEYGEDFLVDKILELKELCSLDEVRYVVDNYKILDEYKYLYLKIDKLADDTIKLEDYKQKEAMELKKRDIDFDKFLLGVSDVDKENNRYNSFVLEQELFLKELEENISKIDSREMVTYRLKGFNKLLGNSFKYLGLLLLSPLKGIVPGIATQSIITKNMISNLRKRLEWEEDRKIVYEAMDYDNAIKNAINNMDYTSRLVDSTLSDIIEMKAKYKNEFSKYERDVPGYRDTMKKLNKMENAILNNKMKIDLMKTRMLEKEKQNKNKLKMVRKLNNASNNGTNS